jgi:hypothetical protein
MDSVASFFERRRREVTFFFVEDFVPFDDDDFDAVCFAGVCDFFVELFFDDFLADECVDFCAVAVSRAPAHEEPASREPIRTAI